MGSVDQRVVDMKFNNGDFEKKVSGTIGVLDKLKQSLNFDSSTKSLQNVSSAAKGFQLDGINTAIDGVSAKFLAMSSVAFTVIQNITNRALAMGEQFVKSFTIAPIIDGFREYETTINSIQTILANTESKGTTLPQVKEGLQKLNEYSDQTIYNFAQMAKNIGTFTAAGVGLDTSISAIKGIANLSALSGSNAEQASTAMYQLSQAISTGTLRLIDWNSVTNAGLGGEVFKKSLFETGKALKTLTDVPITQTFEEWEKANGTFRDSLEQNWITSEVLTTTLAGFTGDLTEEMLLQTGYTQAQAAQILKTAATAKAAATEVKTFTQLVGTVKEAVGTGWADTFKLVLGDFMEAKETFTGLYTIFSGLISRSADSRNNMLQSWRDLKGRESLLQSLRNIMWSLALVGSTLHKAFRNAFPKKTGEDLYKMTTAFEKFTEALIPGENTLKIIGGVFGTVFSILSIGWTVVKEIAKAFVSLFGIFKVFGALGNAPADFFSTIGEKVASLKKILVDEGGIAKFFQNIIEPIGRFLSELDIVGKIQGIIKGLQEFKDKLFLIFDESISPKLQPIIAGLTEFKNTLTETFSSGVEKSMDGLIVVFNKVKVAITKLFGIDIVGPSTDAMGAATGRLSDRWESLMKIGEKLGNFFSWVSEQVGKVVTIFSGFFQAIGDAVKSGNFDDVHDALNVGLFGAILLLINKFMNGGALKLLIGDGLFDKIGKTFDRLGDTLKSFQLSIKAEALMKIAKALGLLTLSLVVLSLIDSGALTKALLAITVGMGQLVGALKLLEKVGGDNPREAAKFVVLAGALILIAGALLVFSFAVKKMGQMDAGELTKGVIAVSFLLGSISAAIKLLGKPENIIVTAVAMYILAKGIGKLAKSVQVFGQMDAKELAQGLVGVTLSLGLLVASIALLPDDTASKAGGIALIGVALIVIAKAVSMFGTMDMGVLAQGLGAVAVAMGIMAAAVKVMGSASDMVATGFGLLIISGALVIMTKVISDLGNMDYEKMKQGLTGVALALGLLALGTQVMQNQVKGAFAILIVSASLLVLAKALQAFLDLGIKNVLLALAGIGIVLGGIAVGGLLLSGVIPIFLAVGKALLIFGAGLALVGGSVFLFGAGLFLAALAMKQFGENAIAAKDGGEDFIKKIPDFVKAVVKFLVDMVKGFLAEAPKILEAFGTMLGSLFDLIIKYAPQAANAILELIKGILTIITQSAEPFGEAIIALVKMFVNVVKDQAGPVREAVGVLLTELFNLIKDNATNAVDAGWQIMLAFARGLRDHIGEVITVGLDIIKNFLTALTEGDRIKGILEAGVQVVSLFLQGLATNLVPLITAGATLIIEFMKGVAQNFGPVLTAGVDLVVKFLEGVATNLNPLITAGANLIIQFLAGVASNTVPLVQAAANVIIQFLDGLAMVMGPVVDAGMDVVVEFLAGIGRNIRSVVDQGVYILEQFLLGIGDPQNVAKIVRAVTTLIDNFVTEVTKDENVRRLTEAFKKIVKTALEVLQTNMQSVIDAGFNFVIKLIEGIANGINENAPRIREAMVKLAAAIINGLTGGLLDQAGKPVGALKDLGESMITGIFNTFQSKSPSKVMIALAGNIADGFVKGFQDDKSAARSASAFGKDMIAKLNESLTQVSLAIANAEEFNPTITPVLDMTNVERGAARMSSLIGTPVIDTAVSFGQAASLAVASRAEEQALLTSIDTTPQPTEVNFNQTINSPTALSVNDIYRNSQSLISIAKEELKVS